MKSVSVVVGTRPDAIKLAPVISWLERLKRFSVSVIATAQHREMLDMVLNLFKISPEIDFDIMIPDQTISLLSQRLIPVMDRWLREKKPDLLIVQGDTTSSMIASMVAYYNRIPVAHVEAGLRTWDKYNPFPEEINRIYIDHTSDILFAPTELARDNLLKEGINERVFVTGNTVIDSIIEISKRIPPSSFIKSLLKLKGDKRLITVTAHRRENFGKGINNIIKAIKILSQKESIFVVWPVHPNPNVKEPVLQYLSEEKDILLTEPLPYSDMIHLLKISDIVLTDSGGLQEECAFLHKPVIVMRNKTERMEIVKIGLGKFVGTETPRIVNETLKVLNDPELHERLAEIPCPYGNGDAGKNIATIIENIYG